MSIEKEVETTTIENDDNQLNKVLERKENIELLFEGDESIEVDDYELKLYTGVYNEDYGAFVLTDDGKYEVKRELKKPSKNSKYPVDEVIDCSSYSYLSSDLRGKSYTSINCRTGAVVLTIRINDKEYNLQLSKLQKESKAQEEYDTVNKKLQREHSNLVLRNGVLHITDERSKTKWLERFKRLSLYSFIGSLTLLVLTLIHSLLTSHSSYITGVIIFVLAIGFSYITNKMYYNNKDEHSVKLVDYGLDSNIADELVNSTDEPETPDTIPEPRFIPVRLIGEDDGSIIIKSEEKEIKWKIQGHNGIPSTDIEKYGITTDSQEIETAKIKRNHRKVSGLKSECGEWIFQEID